MAIKLNRAAYDHAMKIIKNGLEVEHDEGNWKEMKATPDEELRYLDSHTLEEYGLWFLGIDTEKDHSDKEKFVYPVGDFSVIHKSALQEAERCQHHEIKKAAQELLGMIKPYKK